MSNATDPANVGTPTADTLPPDGPHVAGRQGSAAGPLEVHRRVEWVRISDLVQRTGSRVLEQGALAHQQLRQLLAEARRDGTDYLRTALRQRRDKIEIGGPGGTVASDPARRERIGR